MNIVCIPLQGSPTFVSYKIHFKDQKCKKLVQLHKLLWILKFICCKSPETILCNIHEQINNERLILCQACLYTSSVKCLNALVSVVCDNYV